MDIIHADIKYANLVLMENSNIGLIDFDSTVNYNASSKNACNLDSDAFYPFRGTPLFASVDAQDRKLLTKRTDLISLLFSVLYHMEKIGLPWHKKDDLSVMKEKKVKFLSSIHEYVKHINLPKELLCIIEHIVGLKYHETPKYQFIKKVLECWLKQIDVQLIQCGPKQIRFLQNLKSECYKEYKQNAETNETH
eukprot:CAMPEP_0197069790 /NCGR_PEP_ID=MMETSP1384-20130603/195630_1 /TAXON_ID=29189 /ORGANISM="Ammonia sp." /LENGTH=192 /DNA_ID=CAMNT_0042507965 /DNA_START=28 /DNA_END=606 /DNA_ORIENTATION=+